MDHNQLSWSDLYQISWTSYSTALSLNFSISKHMSQCYVVERKKEFCVRQDFSIVGDHRDGGPVVGLKALGDGGGVVICLWAVPAPLEKAVGHGVC